MLNDKSAKGKKAPQKKKSKRKGSEVMLGTTKLYQPNRVTNAEFKGFTLLRIRCFLAIMKHLQDAVKLDMSGQDWTQLSFFDDSPALLPYQMPPQEQTPSLDMQGVVRIQIELSEIGPPEQYQEIYQALDSFRFISLKLEPPKGFKRSNANIAARVDESELINGKSYVSLYLLREVVDQLILSTKDASGKPQQYTSYVYEVALSFRGKYTALLYMLLNSWKVKGIFTISLDKLKRTLGIEDEYPEYSDFKRRILNPAAKEIQQHPNAECYFIPDPTEKDNAIEIREGKKVTSLRIKVQTRETDAELLHGYENTKYFLRNHLQLDEREFEKLRPIFRPEVTTAKVQAKYLQMADNWKRNGGKDAKGIPIMDYKAWICTCLLNEFAPPGWTAKTTERQPPTE